MQSALKYLNLVTANFIEAKCLSTITRKIYRQIFNFSFKCSQRYKIGDLSEYVNKCPETIRIQIQELMN